MPDWRRLPQSSNVIDHRGLDWRIRNAILAQLSPDEVAGDDLGARMNAMLAALQQGRQPQQPGRSQLMQDYYAEPVPRTFAEWIEQQNRQGR